MSKIELRLRVKTLERKYIQINVKRHEKEHFFKDLQGQ